MPTLSRFGYLPLAGMLLLAGAAEAQQPRDNAVIPTVKYADLAKEVLKHKGQVVLVDVWHTA
jgi:hypothetical protein